MIKIVIKEAFEDMIQSGKQAISQHWEPESKKSKEFKKSVEYYSNIFNKIDKSKFPKSLGDKAVQTLSMLFASNPQLAQNFGFNTSVKEQQEQLNYMGGEADKELIDLLFNSLQKVDSKINRLEVSTLAKAILAITKYKKPQSAKTVQKKQVTPTKPIVSQSANQIFKQIFNAFYFIGGDNKIYFVWKTQNKNSYSGYIINTDDVSVAIKTSATKLKNNEKKKDINFQDNELVNINPINLYPEKQVRNLVEQGINNNNINEQIVNRWKLLANIK